MSHRIFDRVRGESSLYRALRATVEIFHRRSEALRDEYVHAAALTLGLQKAEISLNATAPVDLMVPAVHAELRNQSVGANALESPRPNPTAPGEEPTFQVVDRGETLLVAPAALLRGDWESACGCQNNANKKVYCKHVQRCVLDVRGDPKAYVKAWQTPEAWRRQTMVVWSPPGAQDALEGVRSLHENGQVHHASHSHTNSHMDPHINSLKLSYDLSHMNSLMNDHSDSHVRCATLAHIGVPGHGAPVIGHQEEGAARQRSEQGGRAARQILFGQSQDCQREPVVLVGADSWGPAWQEPRGQGHQKEAAHVLQVSASGP